MNNHKKKILYIFGVLAVLLVVYKSLTAISSNAGQQSYELYCAKCHGKEGEGFKALVPPLKGSEWLAENYLQVPCVIRHGISDSIIAGGIVYKEEMLGLPQLNEIQIANICNYIMKTYSNEKHFFTEQEVKEVLDNCAK